jgi:hypothetical protein
MLSMEMKRPYKVIVVPVSHQSNALKLNFVEAVLSRRSLASGLYKTPRSQNTKYWNCCVGQQTTCKWERQAERLIETV